MGICFSKLFSYFYLMKILITGSPKAGKTTLVKNISKKANVDHYCTDPQSRCDQGVKGIPDGLDWSGGSDFVAQNWIGKKTLIEGVAIPRALRKWRLDNPNAPVPCDKLIILQGTFQELSKGQRSMAKGIKTVMEGLIKDWPELLDVIEFKTIQ